MIEMIVLVCLFGVAYAAFRLVRVSHEVSTLFDLLSQAEDARTCMVVENTTNPEK